MKKTAALLVVVLFVILVLGTCELRSQQAIQGPEIGCQNEYDVVCDGEQAYQCFYGMRLVGFSLTRAAVYDSVCAQSNSSNMFK